MAKLLSISTLKNRISNLSNEEAFRFLLIASKDYDNMTGKEMAFKINPIKLRKSLTWIDNKIDVFSRKIDSIKADQIDKEVNK